MNPWSIIIVEGEMMIADETGYSVIARPGDVFYFAKGSIVTFQSPSVGLGFFCGQRHSQASTNRFI